VKWVAVATFSAGLVSFASFASLAHAQTANSQTDGRDYEALAYLPKDTLVGLTYFREVSTSDKSSLSQSQGIFRASYILKFGDLSIVPFDVLLPVVDVSVYLPVPMAPVPGLSETLHTSGLADLTYLPTIGYTITENETSHTVLAATGYITAPTGSYEATRVVNIGDNRWRIQPQVAVSQRFLKVMTVDLVGSAAFYTTNSQFAASPGGYVTMSQNQTFGFEAHVMADLSKDMAVGLSYYLAAIGAKNVDAPGAPTTVDPSQTVQTLRFTYSIGIEKATRLLLQYNQDIEESGGASISRFIGARLSHAVFF
jgi:hypothetical protein